MVGSCSITRCRVRWPPQCVQSPQSDHMPHLQSLTTWTWQGVGLQPCTTVSVPLQGMPPLEAGCRTVRLRSCSPSPQVTVQAPQSDQSCSTQSWDGEVPQAGGGWAPIRGLQSSMSFKLSLSQEVPLPRAYCTMCRIRSRMPWQSLEHSDQSPHVARRQSASSTQSGGCGSQSLNSSLGPSGMAPQAVGSVARERRRFWKPLPQ
mmetsp:Transcript_53234/g.124127  ORF Transcript_53234/g.124127 Transcript_53234/m.124127 type:complete len:204 (-) Transcript_53234:345-956(-)